MQIPRGMVSEIPSPRLGERVDGRLKDIIRETCAEIHAELIEMEVMPDHVHLLVEVDPQYGIHRAVRLIKGRSSRLLRDEYPWLKSRLRRCGRTRISCPLWAAPR